MQPSKAVMAFTVDSLMASALPSQPVVSTAPSYHHYPSFGSFLPAHLHGSAAVVPAHSNGLLHHLHHASQHHLSYNGSMRAPPLHLISPPHQVLADMENPSIPNIRTSLCSQQQDFYPPRTMVGHLPTDCLQHHQEPTWRRVCGEDTHSPCSRETNSSIITDRFIPTEMSPLSGEFDLPKNTSP